MLKTTRRVLAMMFIVGTTLLFLDITGTLHLWLGWMAKIQFVPAFLALNALVVIALLLLTLVLGRIYCSVICPLGIFQDLIAHAATFKKHNPYSFSRAKNILRNIVLVGFIICLIAGIGSVVSLLEPYSAFGRIASTLLQPVYLAGNNVLASVAQSLDSYAFYGRDVWVRSTLTLMIAIVTLAIVGFLAWRGGRTYCNTICPVGTFLGYFSRFAWFRIHFDGSKCTQCGKCTRNCKAACIDFKQLKVDHSRCVTCGNCLTYCDFDAIHFGHPSAANIQSNKKHRDELKQKEANRAARKAEKQHDDTITAETTASPSRPTYDDSPSNTSRRNFLLGTVLATTTATMAQLEKKVDGGLAKIEDKVTPLRGTQITPPGSLSAEHLAQHCTSCQLCVSQCPNDVLKPSTDLHHFMQPYLDFNRGFCRPECTICSEVCPTGAIRKIDKADKSSLQIGHAVWIKKNCVVLNDNVTCGNCARHCPTHAIEMIDYDGPKGKVQIPSVNITKCIGCGACENLCPARPFAAIYVEGHEMHKMI